MKKYSTLAIVHLGLLCAAAVYCVVSAVMLFGGFGFGAAGFAKGEGAQRGIIDVITILSLASGAVYVLKGYGKNAAFFYNAFICLQIAATALLVVLEGVFFGGTATVLLMIAMGLKAVAIALLIFLVDLGEKKSMMLFYVIVALDVVGLILALVSVHAANAAYLISAGVFRLLVSATIGLALLGKYADKADRKSEE